MDLLTGLSPPGECAAVIGGSADACATLFAPGGGQYAGYCDFACGYCAPPPPPPPAAEAAALARCPQVSRGAATSPFCSTS